MSEGMQVTLKRKAQDQTLRNFFATDSFRLRFDAYFQSVTATTYAALPVSLRVKDDPVTVQVLLCSVQCICGLSCEVVCCLHCCSPSFKRLETRKGAAR